jgi:hypothetical protein
MATSPTKRYAVPYEAVFGGSTQILPARCEMTITRADPATGIIEATTTPGHVRGVRT